MVSDDLRMPSKSFFESLLTPRFPIEMCTMEVLPPCFYLKVHRACYRAQLEPVQSSFPFGRYFVDVNPIGGGLSRSVFPI